MKLTSNDLRFFVTVWYSRADLQKAFPEVAVNDYSRYECWCLSYGSGEYPEPRQPQLLGVEEQKRAKQLLGISTKKEPKMVEIEPLEFSGGKVLICGFLQVYNEVIKGNLRRCLENLSKYSDAIVAFDDGSVDESYDVLREYMPKKNILRIEENDFKNELTHKQELFDLMVRRVKPSWAFWMDADEVLDAQGTAHLRELAKAHVDGPYDAFRFREIQLWTSTCWARMDQGFDQGDFIRMWRIREGMCFDIRYGTHHAQFPMGLRALAAAPFSVLHYGNASRSHVRYKAMQYAGGLGGPERHIDNRFAKYMYVPKALIPRGAEWKDESMPEPLPKEYADRLRKCMDEKKEDRVIIIVPVHGTRDRLLAEAVESVIKQTYDNWELYILCDGATKEVVSISKWFANEDPRIHCAVYPKHRGGVAMHPIGCDIAIVRGFFWTRLGSDDKFAIDKLESDMRFFAEHPDVGLVYGPYNDIDVEGNVLDRIRNPDVESPLATLKTGFCMSWANICVRTSVLALVKSKYGMYVNPRLINMEDWDANIRLASVAKIGWTGPEPRAFYRCWGGQSSQENQTAYSQDSTLMQKLLKEGEYEEKGDEEKGKGE